MTDKSKRGPGWAILFVTVTLVAVSLMALFLHRGMKASTVERMYVTILHEADSMSADVENGAVTKLDACEKLLDTWEGISGDRISTIDLELALPQPLIWTATYYLPNDEVRQAEAVGRIITTLRALSGEQLGDELAPWQSWLASAQTPE